MELIRSIMSCNDIEALQDICRILLDKDDMSEIRTRVKIARILLISQGVYNYSKELAKEHLQAINMIYTMDDAKGCWYNLDLREININDWCVLWGEMVLLHEAKIRKWFSSISDIDMEKKITDECLNFLDSGRLPMTDIEL